MGCDVRASTNVEAGWRRKMTTAERLTELLEERGWRVRCHDPLAPERDAECDFLIDGELLHAMTPAAAKWMDWLDAECPSASDH
jgi:hypothetical protein